MGIDLCIRQAIVLVGSDGPILAAQTPDFSFEWQNAVLIVAARFGRPPVGVRCPSAIFATPILTDHVAVVQVADLRSEPDSQLGFRVLLLSQALYNALGDPFAIADRFPADWSARGPLEHLEWPPEPLPKRTVDAVQHILKSGDTALLLGGVQTLIDGGRVLIESQSPVDELIRGIWALLPDRTRCELWPATFALTTDLGFHIAALPVVPEPWPNGVLTADQARDYPEGRYELSLQTAIEAGDQVGLDRLFARRTSQDTLRMATTMLLLAVAVAVISRLLM